MCIRKALKCGIECLEWYEERKENLDSVREFIYSTSTFPKLLSTGMTQGQMGVRCYPQ